MASSILVCGATGFVGTHLMTNLAKKGLQVVGLTRRIEVAKAKYPQWSWTYGDVEEFDSLKAAMNGKETVVFLVHQMRAMGGELLKRERESAERVLAAAEAVGVRRLVYLGGPEPQAEASAHLKARLETGRVLRSGSISTIELRAGMIIGAESESWLMVRDLSLRLPVMILPKWLKSKSQPVGIDDVVLALSKAIALETFESLVFDIPGPETLTCREIIERVSGQVGIRPLMVPVPVLTPALSSHWLRFVTRANYKIAKKLVRGLNGDVIASKDSFWEYISYRPTPLDEVIRRALNAENLEDQSWYATRWEGWVRALSLSPK
jgi:uncharacterized protein YbjT (DUF2867 family)